MSPKNSTEKMYFLPLFQNTLLCALFFLFCVSLFKNISYPLIWNDESETVMMATRVLEYGYPKVHDGKNTVFMMPVNHEDAVKDFNVGYNKKYDAYIGNTWGMYYFGAIGVLAAKTTNDIYKKTFWLRFPFALCAFGSLILLCICCNKIFSSDTNCKYFTILFISLELVSIPLIYHMREVRYYSLTMLATSLFCYVYTNHLYNNKYKKNKYIILMVIVLFVTYHVNYIVSAILCAFMMFYEVIFVLHKRYIINTKFKIDYKNSLTNIMPTVAAVIIFIIAISPFIYFYDMLNVAEQVSKDYNYSNAVYINNLISVYEFFKCQDFLYPAIILTCVMLFLLWHAYKDKIIWMQLADSQPLLLKQLRFSFFFVVFFTIYTLIIARSPYLFVRHYIVLQPILSLIIALNVFISLGLIEGICNKKKLTIYKTLFCFCFLFVFTVNASSKVKYIKEHIYQCTHQYKGVLDYQIPYILEKFKIPEQLTIAVNYEEFSFMYYLKSKVILGYLQTEYDQAIQLEPDIVIYRKSQRTNPDVFNHFLLKNAYARVSFPVFDYPVNNIPEIEFKIPHLFRTRFALDEDEKAELFIRTN